METFQMDGGDNPPTVNSPEPPASGDDSATPPPAAAVVDVDGTGQRPDGCDALARAITSTLGDVMQEFDTRTQGAIRSQDDLALSLDRLNGELDKLLEEAPIPFILHQATKISSIRKRISALNFVLKAIERRIDNMDRMLSTGRPTDHEQPAP